MPVTINMDLDTAPTASSMTLTGAVRSDNGQPPSGASFPISLTLDGGNWVGSFPDATAAPNYVCTLVVVVGAISYPPFQATISGGGGAIGVYTTQALIQQIAQIDGDIWSNIGNQNTSPNQPRYQSAINSVEAIINGRIQDEFYAVPIPPASPQFPRLSQIATYWAMTELYFVPRGLRDGDQIAGQLSSLRKWSEDELSRMLNRPIYADANGTQQSRKLPGPCSLVPSDWFGNPAPCVTNRANPAGWLYPAWFYGAVGAPYGLPGIW